MPKERKLQNLKGQPKEIQKRVCEVLNPPSAKLYRHNESSADIDFLYLEDTPGPGLTSFVTLNLHEAKSMANDHAPQIEIFGTVKGANSNFARAMYGAATSIRWGNFDVAVGNVWYAALDSDSFSRFFVLPLPEWASALSQIPVSDGTVECLRLVPISEPELAFSSLFGSEALLAKFEEARPDFADLNRPSVVTIDEIFDSFKIELPQLTKRAKNLVVQLAWACNDPQVALESVVDSQGRQVCDAVVAADHDNDGARVFSTVNLAERVRVAHGRNRHIELFGVARERSSEFAQVVADLAGLFLHEGLAVEPGFVHENFMTRYPGLSPQLPHVLLDYPRSVRLTGSLVDETDDPVQLLQIVPISDSELEVVRDLGFRSLVLGFEGYKTDLADLDRVPDHEMRQGYRDAPEPPKLKSRSKALEQGLVDFFGAPSKVEWIPTAKRRAQVRMVSFDDQPQPGLSTFATVSLNQKKHVLDGEDHPVELLGTAYRSPDFSGPVATVAFNCMNDGMQAVPGVVHEDVLNLYHGISSTLQHVLITELWRWQDELSVIETPQGVVHRYQVLPISEAEYGLYREQGYEALLDRLQKANIKYWDLDRDSTV